MDSNNEYTHQNYLKRVKPEYEIINFHESNFVITNFTMGDIEITIPYRYLFSSGLTEETLNFAIACGKQKLQFEINQLVEKYE